MAEDEDVGGSIRIGTEQGVAPALATRCGACLVDDRDTHALDLDAGNLAEPVVQLGAVVVARNADEACRARLECVERRDVDPVARVDDEVCLVDEAPHLRLQGLRPHGQVRIAEKEDPHASEGTTSASTMGMMSRLMDSRMRALNSGPSWFGTVTSSVSAACTAASCASSAAIASGAPM